MPSIRGRLIEIQQGSLAALRDKVRTLLDNHDVTVVKPLVARKLLVRRKKAGGAVLSTRYSPAARNGCGRVQRPRPFRRRFSPSAADLGSRVHAAGRAPAPRPESDVGRARTFRVLDRMLVGIEGSGDAQGCARPGAPASVGTWRTSFRPPKSPAQASMPRWLAQKMAYCLRKTGAIDVAGKRGNAGSIQRA